MTDVAQIGWGERLLGAVSEGVVLLDDSERITFFNPGAERITGWTRQEVLGQTCSAIFGCGACDPVSFIPAPGGGSRSLVCLRGNRHAMLAFSSARVEAGPEGRECMALVFRDVTEEETMHRLVGNFLANIGHEFRTPLSALGASVQLLMDQLPDLSPEEMRELLDSLQIGVWRLQVLVDNLLEGASIEAGQFRVYARPCNVREVIAEALFTVHPLLEKRKQHIVLSIPEDLPNVRADFRRTVQVLVNLLNNASKYGRSHGLITIGAEVISPLLIRIAVTDQGAGIPEAVRASLFQPYQRGAVEATGNSAGMGLGLSVVKAIVEAQGGTVELQSVPEGGTRVDFTLPVLDQIAQ